MRSAEGLPTANTIVSRREPRSRAAGHSAAVSLRDAKRSAGLVPSGVSPVSKSGPELGGAPVDGGAASGIVAFRDAAMREGKEARVWRAASEIQMLLFPLV